MAAANCFALNIIVIENNHDTIVETPDFSLAQKTVVLHLEGEHYRLVIDGGYHFLKTIKKNFVQKKIKDFGKSFDESSLKYSKKEIVSTIKNMKENTEEVSIYFKHTTVLHCKSFL